MSRESQKLFNEPGLKCVACFLSELQRVPFLVMIKNKTLSHANFPGSFIDRLNLFSQMSRESPKLSNEPNPKSLGGLVQKLLANYQVKTLPAYRKCTHVGQAKHAASGRL